MNELVSYVIPSHNCAHYLGAAVESVRNQTYKNLEIIVVNDFSTDSTADYLKWLVSVEPRAKVINNEKNLGRSESRNIGNHAAMGKFIYVLDADDLCLAKRTELTLGLFKRADLVHGGAIRIDALNREIGPMVTDRFDLGKTTKDALKQSFVVHSTVCYTRKFASKYPYGPHDISYLGLDDWDQQIRAAFGGAKFEFTPNYLSYYRQSGDGISDTRDMGKVMELKKALFPQLFKEAAIV